MSYNSLTESEKSKEVFKKNLNKIQSSTVRIDRMPKGLMSIPNEWERIYFRAHLALKKHFKRKYGLKGTRQRADVIFKMGVKKHIKISTIYPHKYIINKSAIAAKHKEEGAIARFLQYKNKFFAYDLEDLTIATADIISNSGLIGPCLVIDFSTDTQEDIGNPLGADEMERIFKFLKVPKGSEVKDDDEDDELTPSEKDLTKKQLALFNKPPDSQSIDIGFRNPLETSVGIKSLDKVGNFAHKVRATQLMINRAKATLKRTKDPQKRKNIKDSLKRWREFKKRLIKSAK